MTPEQKVGLSPTALAEQLSFEFITPTSGGPTLPLSKEIWTTKYATNPTETHGQAMERIAEALSDSPEHKKKFTEILKDMRFLPGGRVQAGAGSPKKVTLFNCFVSSEIEDSMESIMKAATEAAETMRRGGGIGYYFGNLRPRGDLIKSLDSKASGPVSFMGIFDAICQTIASAGHRRGAQMAVLPVSHPSILDFIHAKRNDGSLKGFNISVGISDKFMEAVISDGDFNLEFEGRVYQTIRARELWDEIMMSTWDWAEPGVIFLDRINEFNNLHYCETIYTCNPCSEQSLPYNGSCLLGSFNLVKYINENNKTFDFMKLVDDIPSVVRAMDNIVDVSNYPIKAQEDQAKLKRRMGIGVTGMANALEFLGFSYASPEYIKMQSDILETLTNICYQSSAVLAREKGSFPLFDKEKYLSGRFVNSLNEQTKALIREFGIRNSHLISYAPTGTISLTADNVSSGIEPPFSHSYTRTIQTFEGPKTEEVKDYAYNRWGLKCKTANECSIYDHVNVLAAAQKYCDSAVSKTCNVGDRVTFDEFKDVYLLAYQKGCKGITTFRASGKRYGILNEVPTKEETPAQEENLTVDNGAVACYIDVNTGQKECG